MCPPRCANQAKTGAIVSCVSPSRIPQWSSAPKSPLSQTVQHRTLVPSSPVPQRSSTAPIASHVSVSPPHDPASSPTNPFHRLPILCNRLVSRCTVLPPIEQHRQWAYQLYHLAQVSDGGERPRDGGSVRAAIERECRREAAA